MKKEKPWLEVEKHSEGLRLATLIFTELPEDKPKQFLQFGDDFVFEESFEIITGWTGVGVYPPPQRKRESRLNMKRIHALIHPDPKLVPVFGGYFVRPLTVRELFDQFPGPYSIININLESMSRMVWESDQIQDHLPYVYVLPEDGHNEGVLHRAWDRGYTAHHVANKLVLLKDLVLEA